MFQETIPAELISLFFDKYKEVAQAGILEKTVPCPCKFPPCVWNQGELPQLKAPIPEKELQTVAGVGVGVGVEVGVAGQEQDAWELQVLAPPPLT